MEKLLSQLDAVLAQTELQIAAENAAPAVPGYRLPDGLAPRQALRDQIKAGLAQLAADGRAHYHPVEPEARRMKVGSTNRYAYNAQAVADAREGVIVACAATRQETDTGQLVPLTQQARQNLGVAAQNTVTVADTGYGAGADLHAAAAGLPVLVPPIEGKPAQDNPYAAAHFHYDAVTATVTCPQGHSLDHEGHTTKRSVRVERYPAVTAATVPYAPPARAIPRAVRWKSDRTPRRCKRCGSACKSRPCMPNGRSAGRSSRGALANSKRMTVSGVGPCGDWKPCKPSGRSTVAGVVVVRTPRRSTWFWRGRLESARPA